MPKKSAPLPPHLEELIGLLEAQDQPDRLGAIRQVEAKHGVEIDLELVLAEYEAFADRYLKWRRRLTMGVQDKHLGAVLAGKASGSTFLRAQGALGGENLGGRTGGNGRLVLDRTHRDAVEANRKGW